MRFVIKFGRPLLVSLLACSLAMQFSLRADEPTVKSANVASPNILPDDVPYFTTDPDLQFPAGTLPKLVAAPLSGDEAASAFPRSSRRSKSWPVLSDDSPALFFPDADRPLKPVTGLFSENPIWRADYFESWGAHPATPVPTESPRVEWRRMSDSWPGGFERVEVQAPSPTWGLRLDDVHRVVPVSAEEEIDASKDYSVEKCEKCGKCDSCKCVDCPGKGCKGTAAEHPPQQGEAAKVILELMETLGRSVLDGTVFQKEDKQEQEWLKELSADGLVSPREALIQYIRMLEAQQEQARSQHLVVEVEEEDECFLFCDRECANCPAKCQGCPAGCEACPVSCRGCPAGAADAPCLGDGPPSSVEMLREMAVHMEMAANELERREIYHRADQLREVAGDLRQDARQTSTARAAQKAAYQCSLSRDVYAQLHQLREELRRTREELEQARRQHYVPFSR